jgi:hypothetical protein
MADPVSLRSVAPPSLPPPLDVVPAVSPGVSTPRNAVAATDRQAISPDRLRFVAVSASAGAPVDAETRRLEAGVDRCLSQARATYVVDGRRVQAAPQFRMTGGFNQQATRAGLEALAGRLGAGPGKISMDVAGHVLAGRGTTEQIAQVTQALIDAGKLPPALPGERDEARIQRMMWQHGVGIDCAGYVQRAVATASGKTREQLGLKPPLDEDLGSLGRNPHFQKVALSGARAGDVITLRDDAPGQPGHTVLVARHFEADGASMSWRFPARDPAAAPFLAAKRLEVFEVDSSWGAGDQGTHGGVRRTLWIREPESGLWASFDNQPKDLVVSGTPYQGHTVVGAYRPQ